MYNMGRISKVVNLQFLWNIMEPWWKPKQEKYRQVIVYYRHSAQERQDNSIEIQRDKVLDFAERHSIEILDDLEIDKNGITSFTLQKGSTIQWRGGKRKQKRVVGR